MPSAHPPPAVPARLAVLQGYDILEDMYSPKTSVANFAHDLCAKKRTHLDKFMAAMVALMQQYVATAATTNNAGVPLVRACAAPAASLLHGCPSGMCFVHLPSGNWHR